MGPDSPNVSCYCKKCRVGWELSYIPVPPTTGQTELKRMLWGANSTARDFVAWHALGTYFLKWQGKLTTTAAALDALYQVNPGRGRSAAVDAI
jgi:hypothetical protein